MFSVPHRTPFFLPKLFPSLTWRIQNERKELYLTFDDGPVPGPTEFVLDTLASRNIKATFFCIGDNIRKHPEVFKKIIEQGHAVGNHTFNHLNGWKTNSPLYVENIKKCDDIIKENAPQTSNLKPNYSVHPTVASPKNKFKLCLITKSSCGMCSL